MNRLKQLRLEKKMLQSDVAKIIDVSDRAVGFYENEKRDMSPDTILKLADFFNVSTDYLLGKTDVRNPGQKIDDVLNEAMIGMSKKDYDGLTDTQKKQIRDFAIFVKEQKSKGEN